jgi:hypothetical protein
LPNVMDVNLYVSHSLSCTLPSLDEINKDEINKDDRKCEVHNGDLLAEDRDNECVLEEFRNVRREMLTSITSGFPIGLSFFLRHPVSHQTYFSLGNSV